MSNIRKKLGFFFFSGECKKLKKKFQFALHVIPFYKIVDIVFHVHCNCTVIAD